MQPRSTMENKMGIIKALNWQCLMDSAHALLTKAVALIELLQALSIILS